MDESRYSEIAKKIAQRGNRAAGLRETSKNLQGSVYSPDSSHTQNIFGSLLQGATSGALNSVAGNYEGQNTAAIADAFRRSSTGGIDGMLNDPALAEYAPELALQKIRQDAALANAKAKAAGKSQRPIEIKEGNQIITMMQDPQTGEYKRIATGPRFNEKQQPPVYNFNLGGGDSTAAAAPPVVGDKKPVSVYERFGVKMPKNQEVRMETAALLNQRMPASIVNSQMNQKMKPVNDQIKEWRKTSSKVIADARSNAASLAAMGRAINTLEELNIDPAKFAGNETLNQALAMMGNDKALKASAALSKLSGPGMAMAMASRPAGVGALANIETLGLKKALPGNEGMPLALSKERVKELMALAEMNQDYVISGEDWISNVQTTQGFEDAWQAYRRDNPLYIEGPDGQPVFNQNIRRFKEWAEGGEQEMPAAPMPTATPAAQAPVEAQAQAGTPDLSKMSMEELLALRSQLGGGK